MVMYVKISSVSQTTPEDMFTLGVSTSRGNDTKIGQFGSGTLMGVLVWMRHFEKSPIFLINGKKIVFQTKEVIKSDGETFRQVLLCDGRKKTPLSVALEYGELDWKFPELGLREWVSNAIDAGQDANNLMQIVDTVAANDNEVAVFVPYNGIAKEYFDNVGRYFLHTRGLENKKEIPKDTPSKCRLYRHGVFVRELEKNSICDYNLSIEIDECRQGSSDSLIRSIDDHNRYYASDAHGEKIAQAVIDGIDCIETDMDNYGMYAGLRTAWLKIADQGVKVCSHTFAVEDAKPISEKWLKCVQKAAPKMDALADYSEAAILFELLPVPASLTAKFNKICDTIEVLNLHKDMERPKLEVFRTRDGSKPAGLGMYSRSSKTVSMWHENQDSTRTLVHEICHHYSGCGDNESGFAGYAHEIIGRIIDELM